MKKKIPFIIIGAVVLLALLGFGYVKLLQTFGLGNDDGNKITLNQLTLTLSDDYVETSVADRDFTYSNGTFIVTGNQFTTNYFMERGTTVKTKEDFTKFIMDMNPGYDFGKIKEADDYLYFSFGGLINNKSYSKMAAVYENNEIFYFIQIECYTSSEYLLEDEFNKILDTVEFK